MPEARLSEHVDIFEQARARVREQMAAERARSQVGGRRTLGEMPRCLPRRDDPPPVPGAVEFWFTACEALDGDDPEAAEDALRLCLNRAERFVPALKELAILLVEVGERDDEALGVLARVEPLAPEDEDLVKFRALCHDRNGRRQEALQGYRQYFELCPEMHTVPRRHASLRVEKLNRAERAPRGSKLDRVARIPRCEPPRERASRHPEAAAAYASALALLENEDWDAAEAELRLAISRDEGHAPAWRELAMLLVDLERFDESDRPLETALGLDPGDYELLRFQAVSAERRGRIQEALELYRRFLEACPEEHGRVRMHASNRVERLQDAPEGVRPPDEDAGVELVAYESYSGARRSAKQLVAALPLLLLVYLAVTDPGAVSSRPGARPPAGERTRSFARRSAQLLAANEDYAGLAADLDAALKTHLGPEAALVHEAVEALVELDTFGASRALVHSYLETRRPKSITREDTRLSKRLRAALSELRLEDLDRALKEEARRYQVASGAADERVRAALGYLAEDLGVELPAPPASSP